MPALLSTVFAAGLLLVFLSLTGGGRATVRATSPSSDRVGRLLRRSGAGEVGTRELATASTVTGLLVAVVTQTFLG